MSTRSKFLIWDLDRPDALFRLRATLQEFWPGKPFNQIGNRERARFVALYASPRTDGVNGLSFIWANLQLEDMESAIKAAQSASTEEGLTDMDIDHCVLPDALEIIRSVAPNDSAQMKDKGGETAT